MATYARTKTRTGNIITVLIKILRCLLKFYQPGDVVWIHDYHLLLLPQMIRKECPDATIGFPAHSVSILWKYSACCLAQRNFGRIDGC